MKDLWENGQSDFKGKHFTMNDCKLSPKPSSPIKIIAAGQSPRGTQFAAEHAHYNFMGATGHNTPHTFEKGALALKEAAEKTGRDVGAMVLFMIIAYDSDEEAQAKWKHYADGVDLEATSWVSGQAKTDTKAASSATASRISGSDNPVNCKRPFDCFSMSPIIISINSNPNLCLLVNGGALIGSYETVARLLDEAAGLAGTKGIMLIFDDFLEGLDKFGKQIQPLMKSRAHINGVA